MPGFKEALKEQRWDDHRYYHHSIINQALHFVSATTFLIAYVVVWIDPAVASLLGCRHWQSRAHLSPTHHGHPLRHERREHRLLNCLPRPACARQVGIARVRG